MKTLLLLLLLIVAISNDGLDCLSQITKLHVFKGTYTYEPDPQNCLISAIGQEKDGSLIEVEMRVKNFVIRYISYKRLYSAL